MGNAGASSSSGIFAGGETPPNTTYSNVETWDGSSWTETTEVNNARAYVGSSNSGIENNMTMFAGAPSAAAPYLATHEFWNGTSWTELNDLSSARRSPGFGGTSSAALASGGYNHPPGTLSVTEEFTAGLANKTITAS